MNSGLLFNLISLALFDIKDDLTGDLCCNAADLWTSLPAVATHLQKGFILFRNEEPISSSVSDFMNLPAKRMSDSLLKEVINLGCHPHCLPVLVYIFKPLPADQ